MEKLETLEAAIAYTFQTRQTLQSALSHSSYVNEQRGGRESNERLEFLGDSVLGMIAAEYFFAKYPDLPEGELTKLRAAAVCEPSLCAYAKQLNLGSFLLLGRGEEVTGGRERPSILADAFEALIAAVYLDGGMQAAKPFVLRFLENGAEVQATVKDYKTMLQEVIQRNPEEHLEYVLEEENGPAHDRSFVVALHLNSNVIGRGEGKSKKLAEQQAAKQALDLMGISQ